MKKASKPVLFFKSLGVWVRTFWSVVLVILAGRLFFYEEIVNSIESTPHPSLVYTIFGTAALSVLIFAYTLYRYLAEANLMVRMHGSTSQERTQILDGLRWTPDLLPVYRLLINLSNGATHIRAEAFEKELLACEGKVLSRLTLADYLGGALVGLGLVGTFVGLLGTLNDLGKIFESLISVGAKDVDPVAMFGNMIAKLQDPMKGMSTAFVASLYGLMGSLIIGLVALSLRHTGVSLCKSARELLKDDLYGDGIPDDVVPTGDPAVSPAIANALRAIPVGIDAVLGVQKNLLAQNKQLLEEHRAWFDRHRAFDVRLAEVLRNMTLQSDLHAKQLDAYQKSSSPKRWILLTVVSIVTSVVSAVVMILIYVRLGDAQVLKNTISTPGSLMTHPAPGVSLPSDSIKKNDFEADVSVAPDQKAASDASASGKLTIKTNESEQVQLEKTLEQLAPLTPEPISKKQKSKNDTVSVTKKNKDKARAKVKTDVQNVEVDRTEKCELDSGQCAGAIVTHTPVIESIHPAASGEEAK